LLNEWDGGTSQALVVKETVNSTQLDRTCICNEMEDQKLQPSSTYSADFARSSDFTLFAETTTLFAI
jgi:hypothetical protein